MKKVLFQLALRCGTAAFICALVGATVEPATADTVVYGNNFLSSTPGNYATGSILGVPNSVNITQGSAAIVSAPCLAASNNGVPQCLQSGPGASEYLLDANFGGGSYVLSVMMAGGSSTQQVFLQLGAGNFEVENVAAQSPFSSYQLSEDVPFGQSVQGFIQIPGGGVLVSSITVTQESTGLSPAPEPAALLLVTPTLLTFGCLYARKRRASSYGMLHNYGHDV